LILRHPTIENGILKDYHPLPFAIESINKKFSFLELVGSPFGTIALSRKRNRVYFQHLRSKCSLNTYQLQSPVVHRSPIRQTRPLTRVAAHA